MLFLFRGMRLDPGKTREDANWQRGKFHRACLHRTSSVSVVIYRRASPDGVGGGVPEMSQSGGKILKGPFSREGNCTDLSVASSGLRLLSRVFLSSSEDVCSAVARLKLVF